MKKKGYTLAEVLITMGIIGVISAIMIPSIGNARPDKTKMMYLKAYDTLSTIVMNLANDSSLYSPVYKVIGNDTYYYNVEKYPLVNFATPVNTSFNTISENEYKLANLLRESIEGIGSTCTTGSSSCSFTTKDNIAFTIIPSPVNNTLWKALSSAAQVTFYNTVQMTIDGKTFSFYITADGEVVPIDVQGQAYIKYRKKTSGKDSTAGLTAKTLSNIGNGVLTVGDSTKDIIKQ